MISAHLNLTEWQRLRPEDSNVLACRSFGTDKTARKLADELSDSGKIEVLELNRGLELRTTSYVGRLRLGDLTLTIEPKLRGAPFLHLLRYAYGLRHLDLHEKTGYATSNRTFQDLLVQQFAAEAEEIMRRDLHRDYLRAEANLASPRGRIDFGRLAKTWEHGRATLPCVHYPRSEDHVLNRALLAGLTHATSLTTDPELCAHVSRLAQSLRDGITEEPLTDHLIARARSAIDRRTRAYESVVVIMEILHRGEGVSLDESSEKVRLPGFLFDMNLFFQRLLSRFLHEHLIGYGVEDEYRLKELFCYDQNRNPQRRRAPVQKPDFLIRHNRDVVGIIDAKYRDLWETRLPREMLYQLALYALGRRGMDRCAVILYPTMNPAARDQVIVVREPEAGATQAQVILRPVNLLSLEALLCAKTLSAKQERYRLVTHWVFGN